MIIIIWWNINKNIFTPNYYAESKKVLLKCDFMSFIGWHFVLDWFICYLEKAFQDKGILELTNQTATLFNMWRWWFQVRFSWRFSWTPWRWLAVDSFSSSAVITWRSLAQPFPTLTGMLGNIVVFLIIG